jgi:glucose-6-phosphate 1-dehydrogenase
VETFAALRLRIESWRWAGVPFLIRAGKVLPVTATEVLVTLREPPLGKLPPGVNYFRFRLGPQIAISLGARVKRPGMAMVSMPVELSFVEHTRREEVEAYERLLSDAMHGDGALFVREDATEAAWAIVEPILGNVTPVYEYEPGSWGPAAAEQLAADLGGWRNPQPAPR